MKGTESVITDYSQQTDGWAGEGPNWGGSKPGKIIVVKREK
jgi:hypothetical protein